ncbi:MAG: transrane efflux protein [Candidatus Doudnabacteria bacterium]|nr:transrane efflux protein [Candidatus Doudnabacteria bacterium]
MPEEQPTEIPVQQISPEIPQEHGFKKWEPLMVLSLALFIIVLDATLLNVSISVLIKDLHTNTRGIQWVITAYALVLAAFTITGGRIGDLVGRKKMFMVGAAIFALGSFIASISNNLGTMIAGEAIIEGLGAALMLPATSSLLVSTYRGKDRAIAFGVWGGFAAAGSAVGPLLGGWLTTNYSWRWGFRINVIVVIILLLGSFLIKESYDDKEKKQFDFMGVLLSAGGLLAIVYGVIESTSYGWWKAKELLSIGSTQLDFGGLSFTPIIIAVGIIFLILFAIWEIAHEGEGKTPLVSMGMFKNRQFLSGAMTAGVLSLSQAGIIFVLPVFLQSVIGLDAFHTGIALIPISVTVLFAAPLAGVLSRKIPAKYIIQVGMLINLASLIIVRQTLTPDLHASHLIPGLALFGLGMGLVMGPINNLTLSSMPVWKAGEASGVTNTMRQVGQSFGAAIIGAVLITAIVSNLQGGIQNSNVIPAQAKASIITAVANPGTDIEFGGASKVSVKLSPEVAAEITTISKKATTDANREALLYASIFSLLGFLVSFGLPNVRDLEKNQHTAAAGH